MALSARGGIELVFVSLPALVVLASGCHETTAPAKPASAETAPLVIPPIADETGTGKKSAASPSPSHAAPGETSETSEVVSAIAIPARDPRLTSRRPRSRTEM